MSRPVVSVYVPCQHRHFFHFARILKGFQWNLWELITTNRWTDYILDDIVLGTREQKIRIHVKPCCHLASDFTYGTVHPQGGRGSAGFLDLEGSNFGVGLGTEVASGVQLPLVGVWGQAPRSRRNVANCTTRLKSTVFCLSHVASKRPYR